MLVRWYFQDKNQQNTWTKNWVGKNKNTIIDFESSSTNRKPSNVTGATQGILIGTGLAKIIQKKVKLPPKETTINLIRQYKKNPNLENFEKITIGLKLQS